MICKNERKIVGNYISIPMLRNIELESKSQNVNIMKRKPGMSLNTNLTYYFKL